VRFVVSRTRVAKRDELIVTLSPNDPSARSEHSC
jgi:hypothetical protein